MWGGGLLSLGFTIYIYIYYLLLISSFTKQYLQQSKSFYKSDYFLFKIIQVKFNFIDILFWVGMVSFIFYLMNIFNWSLSLILFVKIDEEILVSAILFSLFQLSFLSSKNIHGRGRRGGKLPTFCPYSASSFCMWPGI